MTSFMIRMIISSFTCWSLRCKHGVGSFLKSNKSLLSAAMSTTTTDEKSSTCLDRNAIVKIFQQNIKAQGIDAFIIPTDDPHLSEYVAPFYGRREFISGFTGSAGTALITTEKSLLFTDGRYHNQAELELDSSWSLMKVGLKDVPNLSDYLSTSLNSGSVVGIDPFLHSAAEYNRLSELLNPKGITIKSLSINPVDSVWNSYARPAPPAGLLRVHELQYAGKNVSEKLTDLREKLIAKNTTSIISAALDEIAWLYNIRGSDIPCNPVSVAYALITSDKAYLFIDENKITSQVYQHLLESNIDVRPYNDIISMIPLEATSETTTTTSATTATTSTNEKKKIWIDTKKVNYALYSLTNVSNRYEADSPIVLMKAIKNSAELTGMKNCHYRDGAAMAEFFSWLEIELSQNSSGITEVGIDEKLTEFRKSYGAFELSFPTIAGVGSNGAIIHYRAEIKSCKILTDNNIILLDSGGQYLDGTTDVTRTFHTGIPSDYLKEMFTRVLKGHISIDSRIFPVGTAGCLIDSFAREHLWAVGKDFMHGVGHGVGAALNVHEGPHSISRTLSLTQPLVAGMIVSNEPGYYEDGNFGIRIENLLIVIKKEEMGEYRGRSFLGFERLTHIPIQKKMIDISLLTDIELNWLNKYHQQVKEKVLPWMKTKQAILWLENACAPLTR